MLSTGDLMAPNVVVMATGQETATESSWKLRNLTRLLFPVVDGWHATAVSLEKEIGKRRQEVR